MSYKILYLPTAELVNKYLQHVKDIFDTYEEAQEVINKDMVLMDKTIDETVWINSLPCKEEDSVPKHLLEIIEV